MDIPLEDIKNKQQEPDHSEDRPPISPEQRKWKKRMIRKVIFICLGLIPLFIWIQKLLFKIEISLPINSNILIFALINANVLLVLLVLFLVLRNLAELLFERYQNVLGTKLKTKLVVSFISLSLIPTILLFFVALKFISTSMDYWFNASIEKSLHESLKLAQSILHDTKDQVNRMSEGISVRLTNLKLSSYDSETINRTLENILAFNPINGPDSITLITDDINLEISVVGPELRGMKLPSVPSDTMEQIRKQHNSQTIIQESEKGDLVRCVRAVVIGKNEKNKAVLITSLLVKAERLAQMTAISQGIEGYKQLKYLKDPFKFWLLIILLIVTLLIIFSAIWFGFYISKGITEPVDKLALATKRIAEGDLDFFIESRSDDELGMLVDSFNQMTMNLNTSNKKLAETYKALHSSSQESEQRRRYTEIILQNVSAGVISLDNNGRITTINHFAEKLLNIDQKDYISKRFQDTLLPDHAKIIVGFIDELNITGKTTVEQHLRLTVLQKTYSLLVNFTRLEDENGNSVGYVLVFDNLTKLEKMQRMAAWREVARRIAHEIKNPLTPIQLSAQRLRRRYPEILEEKDSIFDQCTATIIEQVDELKRLVSEFSQFARMPKVHKAPADLSRLAQQTLVLYRAAHKLITFSCTEQTPIPIFSFDAEQIKRCIINLLDNAVAVLPDGGTIDLELSLDENKERVFIKVGDNGPGISKDDKLKLFEPYFSTKKTGTGLGLAIISTIISDHNGYIRVQDNIPHGSVFIIELPLLPGENSET
jgi:two-component system, NtrC family, nitrogen regulation sensor histidine kinase NtrY